jgi:hypothetical protein
VKQTEAVCVLARGSQGDYKAVLKQHDRRALLPGLDAQESQEFRRLDDTVPFAGMYVWPTTGLPALESEERWRELWLKQYGG